MDANVWKVQVEEGADVSTNTVIAILEGMLEKCKAFAMSSHKVCGDAYANSALFCSSAMKLEINVNTPEDLKQAKVEKLLVAPGDAIKAGGRLALLRKTS